MPYTLVYHPLVRSADLQNIPQNLRSRMARAIEARLTTEPERYGAPLKGILHPYRKLRVGDYRVVYRIASREVWILAILHRKEVYESIGSRKGWEGREE